MNIEQLAHQNLENLKSNPYPGRGIVIGLNPSGTHLVQVYWLMGRHEDSKNRVLEEKGGLKNWIDVAAADPSKIKNPANLFYTAMADIENCIFVVSNGIHTKDMLDVGSGNLLEGLELYDYEDDTPNFTQRIGGLCDLRQQTAVYQLAILRRSPFNDASERLLFQYELPEAGYGHMIHTYRGDGNPLPSFTGEPLVVPIFQTAEEIAQAFWDSLSKAKRVALVVKMIPYKSEPYPSPEEITCHIINTRTKIAPPIAA